MTTPHYLDSAYVQALIAENERLRAQIAKLVACWPGGAAYEALKAAVEAYDTNSREYTEELKLDWLDSAMREFCLVNVHHTAIAYVTAVEAARAGGE